MKHTIYIELIKNTNMAGKRLPQNEYMKRVQTCYDLRFVNEEPFGVKEWLEYCKEHYPEKSQQQHTKMWADAGALYKEAWQEKLEQLLGPAVDRIEQNLFDDDGRVNSKAIEQVFRYSGNDVQKIQAEISGDITISFGEE